MQTGKYELQQALASKWNNPNDTIKENNTGIQEIQPPIKKEQTLFFSTTPETLMDSCWTHKHFGRWKINAGEK